MATRKGFGQQFAQIFQGWSSDQGKKSKEEELLKNSNYLDIENPDGAEVIDASYFASTDFATTDSLKEQAESINEYRGMALYPEVEWAIDDIVNAVVSCDSDDTPIELDLEKTELSDATKEKIVTEFDYLCGLIDFNNTAYERLKEWYVDGRLLFQVVVNANKPKEGIQKLIPLDPRAVKKVVQIKKTPNEGRVETISSIDRFYVYDQSFAIENAPGKTKGTLASFARQSQKLRIEEDGIAMVHSGLVSAENNMVMSYLEYARKPLNNLKTMEDAMVIYRITRAPERRAFYVDTGSLPKKSAEEYLMSIMNRFKSKISYDATSGKVNTNAHQMTMMEDYWLPRREGGRGTEITTLPGGTNLNDIDDVMYFLKKLYKSLKVPSSRLEPDANVLIGGRGAEVSRDEWKFDKFVQRLRRRFATLFIELLGRHLVLKNITTEEDWAILKNQIQFNFASDGYMKEQQELDTFANRVAILSSVDGFVGRYFSKETIEREVLRRSDEEIVAERKKIIKELKDGLITISDPMAGGGEEGGGGGFGNPTDPGNNFGGQAVPAADDEADEVIAQ